MSSVSKWRTLIYQTKKKITRGWLKFVNQNPNQNDVRYQDNNIGKNVRLGETTLQGKCAISDNVYLKGDVTIGKYSTIGQECFLYGGKIRIGNYCQLGPRVAIYSINHPTDHITTYVNKNLFDGNLKMFASDEPVEIGNDVWIGYGAILLPGVKVGNGAIVGAGAVVTHNIETYGVAVGNPAKVVKTRFETDIISLLNDWKWWELNPDELNQYQELFCENISNKPEILRNYLRNFTK